MAVTQTAKVAFVISAVGLVSRVVLAQSTDNASGVFTNPNATGIIELVKSFRDCSTCPEMVWVPPGKFLMGTPESEYGRNPDEGPQHTVVVSASFAIGKYLIKQSEFGEFVKATNYQAKGTAPGLCSWQEVAKSSQLGGCLNEQDAKAYATWLAKITGKRYRLPTEAEWEYAARAGTTTAYYWGDAVGSGHAPCGGCLEQEAKFGGYPPNGYGLYDMLGHAWQWVETCYTGSYLNAPADSWNTGQTAMSVKCKQLFLMRGGTNMNPPEDIRSGNRTSNNMGDSDLWASFRVVRVQ